MAIEFGEVPQAILKRARRVCLALPETTEAANMGGALFGIRRRNFAMVLAVANAGAPAVPMFFMRADPEEHEALLAIGHPYFGTRGSLRLGVVIEEDTDWAEVAELVTESYLMVAPKKLASTVVAPPPV